MSLIAEQFSNHHYFWSAAYLDDNPTFPRKNSYERAIKSFNKLRLSAKNPLSKDQVNLYLYHLTDESISRFSNNMYHFAPLSGNPHDLIYKDVINLQLNQDIY
jgi:hypothetical protein